MDTIDPTEAAKLVRAVHDNANPYAAAEAVALKDKWLRENDQGLLQMAADVRLLLEAPLAPSDAD